MLFKTRIYTHFKKAIRASALQKQLGQEQVQSVALKAFIHLLSLQSDPVNTA